MYKEVRHQREAFVAAINAIRPKDEPVPAVAIVSFAAPRVGDKNYSMALGGRSIMCPMGVLEPLWAPSYRPPLWKRLSLTGVWRDWVQQVRAATACNLRCCWAASMPGLGTLSVLMVSMPHAQ
jgi:hypothetical protein